METASFPGSFEDAHGTEQITWRVEPSTRRGLPGYEIHTTIRSQAFWGYDFDGLKANDPTAARQAGLPINPADELDGTLGGDLPCVVRDDSGPTATFIRFTLTLPPRNKHAPQNLVLRLEHRGEAYECVDDSFETAVELLDKLLQPRARLACCYTCLLSDYSPAGRGMMGMSCHRDAKNQYLAVRSKADYWRVPITEQVMETYLCDQFTPRTPGTGYRG